MELKDSVRVMTKEEFESAINEDIKFVEGIKHFFKHDDATRVMEHVKSVLEASVDYHYPNHPEPEAEPGDMGEVSDGHHTFNELYRYRMLYNAAFFNLIEDKLHKISRYIVDFCKSNNIGTIIIGLNKEWKNKINIGKRNNQHFVSIPHSKLIDKIVYKAKLLGINVVIHEESYTSKIDHLAFEPLKKQESYLGKRKKRGLFQSSIGKLINADINGSIGIARKVIGDSFIGKIIDSGFVFNPIRVNTL